jgi:hypothetical protein
MSNGDHRLSLHGICVKTSIRDLPYPLKFSLGDYLSL